ncbi:right-handed parallel beta-helix repeat-containing protein [Flavobacterium aquicola]|uniref:Parallel beta helix pectate lyase-like protein n=1 Tax=Flavobacterium aquicola TaxID=1682742 RepID=A0A3E0E7K2_9FLAO|nr:hypothetical protein [Flavobacterium aquicola]REG92976.1 hypothetical protein C8P67_11475 [Flavobacterium aquicola]
MKKIYLLFVLAVTTFTANATTRTVNNGSVGAGQYTSVQTAVDASAVGDTIYIHGSQTAYGDVTLNKRLVLIGAGHHVKGTQFDFATELGVIYLSRGNSTTLPTGSTIKGIEFSYIYGSGGSLDVNNITLERNYITNASSDVVGNGWILRNNFIAGLRILDFKNIIISNNIVGNYIYNSTKPSVIITNNIFLNGAWISQMDYSTITNNIFIEPLAFSYFTGKQNTWNKNIFIYADPANYKNFPPSGNTGVGNLNTVNAQFTTTIPLNITLEDATKHDWTLLASSIGFKYGTDGTDIGIHGGSYPSPNNTGATNIPQITSMDIQNSVLPQNGTLSIEFKAKGQQ